MNEQTSHLFISHIHTDATISKRIRQWTTTNVYYFRQDGLPKRDFLAGTYAVDIQNVFMLCTHTGLRKTNAGWFIIQRHRQGTNNDLQGPFFRRFQGPHRLYLTHSCNRSGETSERYNGFFCPRYFLIMPLY